VIESWVATYVVAYVIGTVNYEVIIGVGCELMAYAAAQEIGWLRAKRA
jgi:hypothetical protein